MDACSRYNQIRMCPEDEDKTKVMPFVLKNAEAMYQHLVNKVFANLIGKTMEIYVDDMLVKSL